MLQLDCTGVGIVSAKYEQSLTAISGFRVELYVETMKLSAGATSVATAPPASPASQPGQPPLQPKTITKPAGNRAPTR